MPRRFSAQRAWRRHVAPASVAASVARSPAGRPVPHLRKHELLTRRKPELLGCHKLEPLRNVRNCNCNGAPSSAAPAPVVQPSASATAPPNGSGSPPIWIWIVIGLVVLIGATALVVRSARRRAATAADWRTKIIDVYAEGSALLDAMRIADAHGLTAGDGTADAYWSDIQRRADDLTRALYRLREEAADEEDRVRVADVLATLQAARAAMDSERASRAASVPQEELVRSRLAAFEASLRTLRAAHYPQV